MRFTKMHGLGNDYLVVDCFTQTIEDAPALARAMSDRHTGVGSDGLILVGPSRIAGARMEMYNADGSRGRMCGNGLRCVAKYASDRGLLRSQTESRKCEAEGSGVAPWARAMAHLRRAGETSFGNDGASESAVGLVIETDVGPLPAAILGRRGLVCADVGRPGFEPRAIPCTLPAGPSGQVVEHALEIDAQLHPVTCVCLGSSHAVVFVDEPDAVDLERWGPRFEHAPVFPDRINVHFAQAVGPRVIRMRTWERGSGITLACGTGAGAVCVAGVLTGRTVRDVEVRMLGGTLAVRWDEDDHVYITGPAVEVFSGEWGQESG